MLPAFILMIGFALFIGMRPISGKYFGDTANYATHYMLMSEGKEIADKGDWLWNLIMYFFSQHVDVSLFFTFVEIGYFGFTLWACKRMMPNNVLVAFLFCLGAFSFFTYGTNGIRNGLACSGVLLMLSFLQRTKAEFFIALIIGFAMIGIHKSVSLPVVMALLSCSVIRKFSMAYCFWIASIIISLIAGGAISIFFSNFGFDDRMTNYITGETESTFSRTGFRWDFLIYSMMPIILGYYVVIKRGIKDRTYLMLLNTYTLSNAFWVMVIRANFSNRFAYLSWFMYGVVLAYPLLRLDIWGAEQGRNTSMIMLVNVGFTWVMQTFYW